MKASSKDSGTLEHVIDDIDGFHRRTLTRYIRIKVSNGTQVGAAGEGTTIVNTGSLRIILCKVHYTSSLPAGLIALKETIKMT